MCTLTWIAESEGFQIFFNRDEQRARKPALPPDLYEEGGVRFVAPRDGDRGGTWIAADEGGLCLCVLNGSAESVGNASEMIWETRGRLPYELVGAAGAVEAADRLARLALDRFRPFILAAFDARGGMALARWDGQALALAAGPSPAGPLVSSSYSTEQVRLSRRETFENLERQLAHCSPVERHLTFHRSHEPERGPRSPCMHRDDATTVSFTRVQVGRGSVRMHYVPHAPCRGLDGTMVELPRSGT